MQAEIRGEVERDITQRLRSMCTWWSPERPYAIRIEDGAGALHAIDSTYATLDDAQAEADRMLDDEDAWSCEQHDARVVTVDLETGEEVSA